MENLRKIIREILSESFLEEDINIPIKVGDTVLGGKFKNKKILVKDIGKNEKGEVTINGKPLMRFRIIKPIDESLGIFFLSEYNENDSFLSNYDTAEKFAYDNIEGVAEVFDEYKNNPNDIHAGYKRDKYKELIDLYVDKYNELKNQGEVIKYRMVKIDSIENLDITDIGKHWSFKKEGVGAYGEAHPNRGMMSNGKPFILTAEVDPKFIDWIYGFHSFIWYGEDQWECALVEGTQISIFKINDSEVSPILAVVGEH
jgi:hypothetical protein